MTAGVQGDIAFSARLTQYGTTDLSSTPKMAVSIDMLLSLLPGTDATNKANILWRDGARSIAASSTEDLDLAGVLADAFGATVAAAEIVAIFIKAASTNTNNVVAGPGSTASFLGPFGDASDRISIKPGEWLPLVSQSGWPVTLTTADKFFLGNSSSGTAVVFDILIVGRTVAA